MKEKVLIIDARLTPTMDRTRSGHNQIFRERNQQDTIELRHKDKSMYAELIDQQWYWVTGCEECKGNPRDSWKSYVECDKHDVCSCCGVSSKKIKGVVWGGNHGWTCKPCKEAEILEIRRAAFEKLDGEEPDTSYTDDVICPHCGSNLGNETHESESMECSVCEGELHIEVEYTRSYSTAVKGKRITE